jgi:hypothetical protein
LWLDNTGGIPWANVAAATSNWKLLPNSTGNWQSVATGSFLTTAGFHLHANQQLTVNAAIFTGHGQPFLDVGFGLLMSGSTVKDVLFALRPDNGTRWGDMGPVPENTYAPTSPGVTLNPAPRAGNRVDLRLGSVEYGLVEGTGDCDGQCSSHVTATCTPGAGSYSLLFGMFGLPPVSPTLKPAAMIVWYSH